MRTGRDITIATANRIRRESASSAEHGNRLQKFLASGEAGESRNDSPAVLEIIELYDSLVQASSNRRSEIAKRKIEQGVKRDEAKRRKVETMKENILSLLVDPEGIDSPHVWFASYAIDSKLYRNLTVKLRKAPSKITKKALKAIAGQLFERYGALPRSFCGMDFLNNDTVFERSLREQALEAAPYMLKWADDYFFEAAKQGHLKEAVLYNCKHSRMFSKFGFKFRPAPEVEASSCSLDKSIDVSHEDFAVKVWEWFLRKHHDRLGRFQADPARMVSVYKAMEELFPLAFESYDRARSAARLYVSLDWLEDRDKAERVKSDIWWMGAMKSVLRGRGMEELLSEPPRFESLLSRHDGDAAWATR